MTENWYIVLELAFDPNPVVDEAIIERRIEEKRKFWSGKANDFKNGPQYRKYSQMLNDIKRDMIGKENIRQVLIQDACDKTYESIDKILKQIRKTEIPSETIGKIAKKQKVAEDIVIRRAKTLGIEISESQAEDNENLYEIYYKAKPLNADKFNGMKQMLQSFDVNDLYQFLYMGKSIKNATNLTCDALRQKAKERKTKEFNKNDSISGTGSKLCGYCEDAFKDVDSKMLYDKYLEYMKRKEVLDNTKEIYEVTGEISREQYSDLVGQLTESFKDRKLAERMFTVFCKMEKIPLLTEGNQAKENSYIKICRCGCTNDTSDGRKVCKRCNSELQIKCPVCSSIQDANINVCKCGFKFENIDKANAFCELAEADMNDMDFSMAHVHLQDAENYWPGNQKICELNRRLLEKEQRIGSIVNDLKEACRKHNYYEARKHYTNIKKFSPGYFDKVIEEEMNTQIAEADRYKEKAKNANLESGIVDACTKAYEACNDCPGIREIIIKYPPSSPTQIKVAVDADAKVNVLSWTKSDAEGLVYYTVVRKIGAIPISIQDGEKIGRVSMCTITDDKILPGTAYYYSVFAQRADIYSNALTTPSPVINLFEISGINVVIGDASLQFTWDSIAQNASVEIEREVNGKKSKLHCNNRESFIDCNLMNDVVHHYRLYLIYKIGSNTYETKGKTIVKAPIKPPLPIEKIMVKPLQNNEFSIEWNNSENSDIQFYISDEKPNFACGSNVSLTTLEQTMRRFIIQKKTNMSGTFTCEGDAVRYIIPVVVKSECCIVGNVVKVNKGGTIKIKEVHLVNGKILIQTDAPKRATGFVVLYKSDQFPQDISDVSATRKYIPLKQFEYDCGLLIDADEEQNYYFSVFAEFKIDDEKEYSVGTDYFYSNIPKEIINYAVHINKKLFGQSSLELKFTSNSRNFTLPAIDIMASIGAATLFKKSARLFYHIEQQEVNNSLEIVIPLEKGISKDTYIKAFLQDETLQGRYQLKLKIKSELKIS